jgi:hypothetical protein
MPVAAHVRVREARTASNPTSNPKTSLIMNLLKPLLNGDALLRQVSRLERPLWLVTCVLKWREPFGNVSTETRYELTADTEDEARDAVRDFVRQSRPRCSIESIQITRQTGVLNCA